VGRIVEHIKVQNYVDVAKASEEIIPESEISFAQRSIALSKSMLLLIPAQRSFVSVEKILRYWV
jgi:hypothetical protein